MTISSTNKAAQVLTLVVYAKSAFADKIGDQSANDSTSVNLDALLKIAITALIGFGIAYALFKNSRARLAQPRNDSAQISAPIPNATHAETPASDPPSAPSARKQINVDLTKAGDDKKSIAERVRQLGLTSAQGSGGLAGAAVALAVTTSAPPLAPLASAIGSATEAVVTAGVKKGADSLANFSKDRWGSSGE